MNRTERAKKRALRSWQDEVRKQRNKRIADLTVEKCGTNQETWHQTESKRVSNMKKYVKQTLKKEKIAVIKSKEKIGA